MHVPDAFQARLKHHQITGSKRNGITQLWRHGDVSLQKKARLSLGIGPGERAYLTLHTGQSRIPSAAMRDSRQGETTEMPMNSQE